MNPFDWSLEAFRQIFENEAYRTIAIRTIVIAALVTVTDAVLAFPIAYYMARVASPRRRRLLVVAVLLPLWASYLVKIFAWRTILQSNGFLTAAHTTGHQRPGHRRDCQLVDRVQLPLAPVHDPAALRGA